MKDDGTAMVNNAKDTAHPADGSKETPVKATEWSKSLQTERRTRKERRHPHSVRAGNPDRRTPDRREADHGSDEKK